VIVQTKILIVEPLQSMANAIAALLNRLGYTPLFAASTQALKTSPEQNYDLILIDEAVIRGDLSNFIKYEAKAPTIVMSATGSARDARQAINAGAVDYLLKPFSADDLRDALDKGLSDQQNNKEASSPKCYIAPNEWPSLKNSVKMQQMLRILKSVCTSSVTVLISGNSGTGKEIIAKHIHEQSSHSRGPLIAINCAAIPENLLEAELFGHERGAFTGAMQSRIGKFSLAKDGTIFLDEISEMDLSLQAKLLRVLQEREYYTVGGTQSIQLKARIIASTNRDLKKCVEQGTFREDLYYRLHVIPVHIPSLCDRKSDVLTLTQFFLEREKYQMLSRNLVLSEKAKQVIHDYDWPGNIRELENTIIRAAMLCENDIIEPNDLTLDIPQTSPVMPITKISSDTEDSFEIIPIRDMERRLILQTLNHHEGNRTHTAQSLGISLRTLRNKLNEYQKDGISIQ